jgi:O-Antigen ligase
LKVTLSVTHPVAKFPASFCQNVPTGGLSLVAMDARTSLRGRGPWTRLGRQGILLAPALAAVGVFLTWGARGGGYPVTSWLPGALFVLGLVAIALVAHRRDVGPSGRAAIALFAAFTAWSFLSIAWAGVKGDAWDGANRTLLYLLVFSLFALLPWTAARGAALLYAWAGGTVVVALVTVEEVVRAQQPAAHFIGSRLTDPTGYSNATAALFLLPVPAMLLLASRREQTAALRAYALAAAGFLLQVGFVPESRGAVIALPITLAAYVLLAPNRLRSLVPVAIVVVASAAVLDRLLGVYRAGPHGDLRGAMVTARNGILVSAAILFAAGFVYAYLDKRLNIPGVWVRRLNVAVAAGAVLCAVAVAAGLAVADHPGRHVDSAWHSFKSPREPQSESSHLTSLGSNRYDFWRVSLLVLRDHPLQGAGVDNFAADYVKLRRSHEEPLYPHSLEMRLLAGTGMVGTALFVAFLAAVVAAGLRRARGDPMTRVVAAAALASAAYWLVHGSGDWLWEFPALGAPAAAMLGLAVGVRGTERPASRRRGTAALGIRVALAAGFLFALASLAAPWLAAVDVDRAVHVWRAHPQDAYRLLGRARRLNFLSENADVTAGAIASRRHEWPRMKAAFERALRRNPSNWYAQLELGVEAMVERRFGDAVRHLEAGRALNPREPLLRFALGRARQRRPVPPSAVDRVLIIRLPPH